MKSLKDTFLRPLINLIPFSIIKRLGSHKLIILYYHVVNDDEVPHIRHLYKHKRKRQFLDDLEFLLKEYAPIELTDVMRLVRGERFLIQNSFF